MKKIISLFLVTAGAFMAFTIMRPVSAAAFTGNNLIDDRVFDNVNSMSASQIDAWLNASFPNSCISSNNGFAAADPAGYSPSGGFTYGGAVSAGQVIYDAGQAYGLNPQVLITTLQMAHTAAVRWLYRRRSAMAVRIAARPILTITSIRPCTIATEQP
jgi:hypothetical protein